MNKNKARILGFILCLSAAGSGQADPRGAVRDVPIDVASIGGEQLLDQGIGNVEDFLQALPGISSLNQDSAPAGTNVDLRGLGSDRTLVLINGRRFATPTTIPGATGPAEGTGIDLGSIANSIERVEVLQDGAAATFGRDAVAGVVNFVTKRDEFSFDARASYSLNDTQRIFSDYKFAIQSNEQCDATTGEANPLWSHQDKHNFGLPEFEDRGHKIYFGSTDDGYREGGFDSYGNYPSRFVSGIRVRPDPLQTFVMFDMLVDLVKNDSSISQGVKDAFFFVTGMSMMYGGADLLSDQAYMLGTFNPEDWYERLKRASAEDAGTVPTVSTPPLPPPVVETEVPAEDANLAPFDKYPYPPDYSFDFSQCTVEQRDQVIKLIRERDAARATMGYYMDYLRREGQTAEDTAEDMRQVDAAIKLRDDKNQELKDYWRSCQLPAATSQASATPATSADAQAATGDAAATAPGESNEQPGKPGSCAFDESTRFNWNLEFHVYERYRLGDGSMGSRPAEGLGLDVFERDDDLDLEIPFISPRIYFDYKAFSDRRPRTFTDSTGRACVPLDKVSPQFYLSPDMLREILGPDYLSGTSSPSLPVPRSRKSGAIGSGLNLGIDYEYRFEERTPQGRDWQIAVDVAMRGNFRPTLGVKLNWDKVDSVVQEYPGFGRPGMTFNSLPSETRDAIPDDWKYRIGAGFSIGDSFYLPFSYSEVEQPDLGFLNNVPGQSGYTNNMCGEKAFPPQGAGYLTREQTPVKTLEDRWAIERANVPGNDSLYIEFADPVIVGIIDTGLDWHHPDISWDNLWRNEDEIPDNGIDDDGNGYVDDVIGWNFMGNNNEPWDNDGHGTFVAGIVAATRGNDIGIDGINPNAKIMVLKALNNFGRTRASYIAQAIVYGADNGARVLNLSVTGPGFPKVVQDAVNYAESKGVLVVVAAGNRAEDIDRIRPSVLQGVLTVAATGPDDKRTVFSNVGNAIDIAAPGQDVVSLRARRTDFMYSSAETTYVPGDAYLGDDAAYYRATGTSFATPIVSGAASLIFASQPNLSPAQVKRMLEQSARDIETPGRDRFTGYGLVDAEAALGTNPEFFIYADIPAVRRLDLDGQSFLQVFGVADANQFASASLEIGQGDNPTSWTKTGSSISEPVQIGELGRIPAEQLQGAQTFTIRLLVQHQAGPSREARYVVDLE